MDDAYHLTDALTPNELYFVVFALSGALALAASVVVFRPRVISDVQTGKVPTGRSALLKIAHTTTLTLGRITFAALHLFERLGVNMSAVDDALAAWTQYATDQKAHLQDLQAQLETLQQTNQQVLADKANDVTAEDAKVADQISKALDAVKNPPQPPSPVSTTGTATPAPAPTVDTGNPIANPAPTPVVSGDPTTAGEVATKDPTTPVVPTAGVGSDGSVSAGVQPVAAGDLPPATPVTPVTSDPKVDGTTPTVTPVSTPTDPGAAGTPANEPTPVADPAPITAPVNPESSASAAGADGTVAPPTTPVDSTTPAATSADTSGGSLASADPAVGSSTNPAAGLASDPTGAAPADPNAPAGAATGGVPVAVDSSAPPVSAGSLPAGTSVVEVAPQPIPGAPATIPADATAVPVETLAPGAQVTPVQDAGTATS